MSWFVLCVKAQEEIRVANILERMNVEVFCPIIRDTRDWSDRKKTVETPLFKGYVFVNLEEKYRGIVFGAPGVIRYLFWQGKPAIIKDEEIWTIKKWMVDDTNDVEALSKLIPGSEVVIEKGVLKDHSGVVYWVRKNNMSFLLKEMGVEMPAKLKEVV
ncbi:MAG: UpxY family transcription antiterminator [Flavobacteriales bacterium]